MLAVYPVIKRIVKAKYGLSPEISALYVPRLVEVVILGVRIICNYFRDYSCVSVGRIGSLVPIKNAYFSKAFFYVTGFLIGCNSSSEIVNPYPGVCIEVCDWVLINLF